MATEIIDRIESTVRQSGFSTPSELMSATGVDYATLCDTIEKCKVRGLYRGALWGYVTASEAIYKR